MVLRTRLFLLILLFCLIFVVETAQAAEKQSSPVVQCLEFYETNYKLCWLVGEEQ